MLAPSWEARAPWPHQPKRGNIEETHDKVRVYVSDRDTFGHQLGGECIRPSAEEGLAAQVDGGHGSGRGSGERARDIASE